MSGNGQVDRFKGPTEPAWVAPREHRPVRGPTETSVWRGAGAFTPESGYAPAFSFKGWAFPNALRILYWVFLLPAELAGLLWLVAILEMSRFDNAAMLGLMFLATISGMLLLPILLRVVHDAVLLVFTMAVAWLRLVERRTWG